MEWIGKNWLYDENKGMYRNSTPDITSRLIYRNNSFTFSSDKSYFYKTKIYNLNQITGDNLLSKETNWGDSLNVTFTGGTNSYPVPNGYIYLSSSPITNTLTNNWLIYSATASFTQSGIKNVIVYELDWKMNGVSWINNGQSGDYLSTVDMETVYSKYCPGWTYLEVENRFMFFGASQSNPKFYPRGGSNNNEDVNYLIINCIYKYIEYQTFNLEFNYFKYTGTSSEINKGLRVYLSDTIPPNNTDLNNWYSFINKSVEIGYFTESSSAIYIGLAGSKYLIFVGEKPETLDGLNIFDVYGIEIEGGYHPLNNQEYKTDLPNITVEIQGATFSAISGSGALISGTNSTSKYNLLTNLVYSKIGNSLFRSGIWENGVWNNGWRKDENVREFYEIDLSLKTRSDVRWRFRITGPSESVASFNIGDEISIGNIIGIDINEKRKLLKGSYRILSKSNTGIDSRTGFIIVETETTFPLRRIEKDSSNHRIYITKNIWLSGAFLNGYYSGVWNNGLFKGYPLITESFNTQWIDGIFDGGHFSTDYYIQGSFSQTFYSTGDKVGLSFSKPHNLKIGDIIEIDKSNKSINSRYDGQCKVTGVLDDNSVTTDIDWGTQVNNESGSYYSSYTTGVIQNMKFKSNNISKITSYSGAPGQMPSSPSVFTYNSWMDVKYQNNSAVNIGKQQTWLNEVSRRYYSENNLYGYPTNDILESMSKFRDSYSLTEREYKLGVKYTLYSDFIGESSVFSDYFGPNVDSHLFLDLGWTYSVETSSYATFSRTIPTNSSEIQGEELKIKTNNNGTYLDISTPISRVFNRTLDEIEKNRYTVVEFDLITYSVVNTLWYPTKFINFWGNNIPYPDIQNAEPVINFNNINKSFRDDLGVEKKMTYLPIYENINHLKTKNKKKVEYFYNKRNLSINFRGNGWLNGISGGYDSEFIVNNIKIIEVDMIPFFKYFNYNNINFGIQTPLKGIAPYIDYLDSNFKFLDNINIGLDSISTGLDTVINNIYNLPDNVGNNLIGLSYWPGLLSETKSWLERIVDEQFDLPSYDNILLINNLLEDFKSIGVLENSDYIAIYATDAESGDLGRINLIKPSDPLANYYNGIEYSQKQGIKGDGSDAYVDTNFNPSNYSGSKMGQNSATIGAWIYSGATSDTMRFVGNKSNSPLWFRLYNRNVGTHRFLNNSNLSGGNLSGTGWKSGYKTGTASVSLVNGTVSTNYTVLTNTSTFINENITLLVSQEIYGDSGISLVIMGSNMFSMNDAINSAITDYMDALNQLQL